MRRDILTQPKVWVTALSIVVILPIIMNIISDGRTGRQISRLNPVNEAERITLDERIFFEEILLDGFRIEFITQSENLSVEFDQGTNNLSFRDTENQNLTVSFDSNIITINDDRYSAYRFILDGANSRLIGEVNNRQLELFMSTGGFLVNGVGGINNIVENPARFRLLDGFEEFGSQRGYIWSRSIPMLRDTLFIGHGPDMYVTEFPQRDFAGRLNGFVLTGINDKPHNMFLQIGINTGFISLLALMSVYGIYLIDSLRLFIMRRNESYLEIFGVFAFAAVSGYLVAGIFNDQIISVAPLFYTLTGVGIAINWLIRVEDNQIKD